MIFLVMIALNIGSIFIMKEYFTPKIKTIDLTQIINEKDDAYKKLVNGEIKPDEYKRILTQKAEYINKAVEQFSGKNDVILLKEFVVNSEGSNQIQDITSEIKRYVEEHTIFIKK